MNRDSKEVDVLANRFSDIRQIRYQPRELQEQVENYQVSGYEGASPGKKKEVRSTDERCLPLLLEVAQDAEVSCYCPQCHKGLGRNENDQGNGDDENESPATMTPTKKTS